MPRAGTVCSPLAMSAGLCLGRRQRKVARPGPKSLLRWLNLIAITGLAGGFVVVQVCLRGQFVQPLGLRWAIICSQVALAAGLGLLAQQIWTLAEFLLSSLPDITLIVNLLAKPVGGKRGVCAWSRSSHLALASSRSCFCLAQHGAGWLLRWRCCAFWQWVLPRPSPATSPIYVGYRVAGGACSGGGGVDGWPDGDGVCFGHDAETRKHLSPTHTQANMGVVLAAGLYLHGCAGCYRAAKHYAASDTCGCFADHALRQNPDLER